jgi:hypothetical protein
LIWKKPREGGTNNEEYVSNQFDEDRGEGKTFLSPRGKRKAFEARR